MSARVAPALGAAAGLVLLGAGCGGDNHPEVHPFGNLPRRLVDDEIALGVESLGRSGVTPALFRPPAGSATGTVVLEAGSIVELHDGGGDRSATIAALPGIVTGIRHRHLRLVALTPR